MPAPEHTALLTGREEGTMRHRIAFSSVLVYALAACRDSPSPVGPAATESASLKRSEAPTQVEATARLLVTGLDELQGSTVGPGGALFVTATLTGKIWRVNPKTGALTLFASGLPPRLPGPFFIGGGVVDVAFLGQTAYALVTGVGTDIGGHDIVGIYRVNGPNSSSVIADIGAFSVAHPPVPPFFVPTGWQYAIESFRDGFLVTDGHHNRVLQVTRETRGRTVFISEAGPIPHLPQDGKVVRFEVGSNTATQFAVGARLLVDVEFGPGGMFALSQGFWDGPFEGTPAQPNTGSLVRINEDGTFRTIASKLDRPTSLEIIGNTAYVVTIGGQVWTVDITGKSSGNGDG